MWVRYGAVGFIAAVARTLNVADVHCNLLPQLQPFLKQPVVQVDKEVSLFRAPQFQPFLRQTNVQVDKAMRLAYVPQLKSF